MRRRIQQLVKLTKLHYGLGAGVGVIGAFGVLTGFATWMFATPEFQNAVRGSDATVERYISSLWPFVLLAWGLLLMYRCAKRQYTRVYAWQKAMWWCIDTGLWAGVFWFMADLVEEYGVSTALLTAPTAIVGGSLVFGLPLVWGVHWWREYNRPAEEIYPPLRRWW